MDYQKFLRGFFPILLVATVLATGYFVTTVGVLLVPRDFPFGFVQILPFQYWLSVVMAAALLLVSVASGNAAYLWISSLLLIVLVPGLGSLVRAYPVDTFSAFASARILSFGGFSVTDNVFLNFPGSTIIFSMLEAITGATSLAVTRGFGLVYNVILAALSFVFFRRLGVDQRAAILGGLLFVLSFYMQGVLVYTSLMGMIFYVEIAAVVFAPRTFIGGSTRTFLLLLLFTAMVVSHAFSPFMTMAALTVTLAGWKFADRLVRRLGWRRLFGDPSPTSPSILIPLMIILSVYWMYFASLIFTWGVLKLKTINIARILGGAASPLVSPGTVYASNFSHLAALYAPLLFGAFAIFLLATVDRRKLQLLLWLVGLGCTMVIAMSGYLQEFLARIFGFAILILSYGLAKLFASNQAWLRRMAIVVLLAALCLHLPAHYGQDSFLAARETTVQGARFLAAQPLSNESVDTIYSKAIYGWDTPLSVGSASFFLYSYQTRSWIAYTEGDLALQSQSERLRSTSYDCVYSNGSFDIYSLSEG